MNQKEYEKLKYPDPERPEFIDYIRDHNKVVHEDQWWIIVENCKYHTDENPHYTAFTKTRGDGMLNILVRTIGKLGCFDWHVYKNQKNMTTITRPHWHIVRDINYYIENYLR